MGRIRRVPEDGHPRGLRHGCLEQFHLFPLYLGSYETHTREVPARSGQASYQACLDRIAHMRHDDGDRTSGVLHRMTRFTSPP